MLPKPLKPEKVFEVDVNYNSLLLKGQSSSSSSFSSSSSSSSSSSPPPLSSAAAPPAQNIMSKLESTLRCLLLIDLSPGTVSTFFQRPLGGLPEVKGGSSLHLIWMLAEMSWGRRGGIESVPNEIIVRTLELLNAGGSVTVAPFDKLSLQESVSKVVGSVLSLDSLKVPSWVRLSDGKGEERRGAKRRAEKARVLDVDVQRRLSSLVAFSSLSLSRRCRFLVANTVPTS